MLIIAKGEKRDEKTSCWGDIRSEESSSILCGYYSFGHEQLEIHQIYEAAKSPYTVPRNDTTHAKSNHDDSVAIVHLKDF